MHRTGERFVRLVWTMLVSVGLVSVEYKFYNPCMIDPGCLRDVKVAGATALHAQGWRLTVAEGPGRSPFWTGRRECRPAGERAATTLCRHRV